MFNIGTLFKVQFIQVKPTEMLNIGTLFKVQFIQVNPTEMYKVPMLNISVGLTCIN
jgi:hypothetical protein